MRSGLKDCLSGGAKSLLGAKSFRDWAFKSSINLFNCRAIELLNSQTISSHSTSARVPSVIARSCEIFFTSEIVAEKENFYRQLMLMRFHFRLLNCIFNLIKAHLKQTKAKISPFRRKFIREISRKRKSREDGGKIRAISLGYIKSFQNADNRWHTQNFDHANFGCGRGPWNSMTLLWKTFLVVAFWC